MYLVIAEKPSVSQSIAKVIGAYEREDGYLKGKDCMVSWCLGHLAEYVSPEAYDEKYRSWNFDDLPIIPRKWQLAVAGDKKQQFSVLKKLLQRNDLEYVVNACDAGREGELIFQRVYELSDSYIPVKRLWISSMEDSAILQGMEQLRDGREYDNLCQAAISRAQADWLIGMNATRAFTTTYFKKLVVGRVQTPTLAMLVERNRQITDFQKVKYSNIHLDCGDFSVHKEKIFEEEKARELAELCDGKTAVVRTVVSTDKVVNPPKLYDLTTLQRESNRYYGYTAQQTLDFTQSLYEKKLVTYPRTDSQFLTEDMEKTTIEVIGVLKEKYGFGKVYPWKPDVKRVMNNKKVSNHHAIIPTMQVKENGGQKLSEGEEHILLLISQRLLSSTAQKHEYTETEITVVCEGEVFAVKGRVVKENGWKDVEAAYHQFGKVTEDNKEASENALPLLEEGQEISSVKASKTEHFTTPPKPFSEDTLLSAMETAGNKEFDEETEKKGFGTPATRASIIEKLVSSRYAKRKGKQIVPTEDGIELIGLLPDNLKSAGMTAEWENQLLAMEKGAVTSESFLGGITGLIDEMLQICKEIPKEEKQRFQKKDSLGTCPVCGGAVQEGKQSFYCSNRECNFALWKDNRYLASMKKKMDKKMAAELLDKGKCHVKDLYSVKKDRTFDADLILTVEDGRAKFGLEFPKKTEQKAGTKKPGKKAAKKK
ncbi:MAG: DNA topoisomerase III [Clostridia bacterium]|nr:DNA topoisomerase III [Clostridia bacterium]